MRTFSFQANEKRLNSSIYRYYEQVNFEHLIVH